MDTSINCALTSCSQEQVVTCVQCGKAACEDHIRQIGVEYVDKLDQEEPNSFYCHDCHYKKGNDLFNARVKLFWMENGLKNMKMNIKAQERLIEELKDAKQVPTAEKMP